MTHCTLIMPSHFWNLNREDIYKGLLELLSPVHLIYVYFTVNEHTCYILFLYFFYIGGKYKKKGVWGGRKPHENLFQVNLNAASLTSKNLYNNSFCFNNEIDSFLKIKDKFICHGK